MCEQCGFVAKKQDALRHHSKSKHELSPMPCTEAFTTELKCGLVCDNKIFTRQTY